MMKKLVMFGIIAIFLLSGCEELKELYGIQPAGDEEYIPIEEIKMEEETTEMPLSPPETDTPESEEISIEVIEIIEEEPEELIEIVEEEPEVTEIEEPEEIIKPTPVKVDPKGDAKVLIVKETEMVSLKPKASDPDQDRLQFSYTSPIGPVGKWQTTYGDAGEYAVTITASDGELSVTKDVLIIVNKKEEVPTIDEALPKEDTLTAKENSKLDFSIKASDLNKDNLVYSWKLDGDETSKTNAFNYEISFDDAGQHTIKVVVSDGINEASKIWAVKVDNVNRKPLLARIADMSVKETDTVTIVPKATDPDKEDKLTFAIDNNEFKKVGNKFEWKTSYDDSGEYTVTITASDGEDDVSQSLKVTVENVNRPPVIEDIVLG